MNILKRQKSIAIFLIVMAVYFSVNYLLYIVEKDASGSNINNYGDTFWYSIITLTTIGYGDKFPVTGLGKIIALIYILGSLGVLGFIISRISNIITKMIEDKQLGFNGTRFENHIVIINFNQFAQQILKEAARTQKTVRGNCTGG